MRKSGDMIRDQVRILYLLFLWFSLNVFRFILIITLNQCRIAPYIFSRPLQGSCLEYKMYMFRLVKESSVTFEKVVEVLTAVDFVDCCAITVYTAISIKVVLE